MRARLVVGALGTAAVLYGVALLVVGGFVTDPPDAARWLVGGVLAHDLLLSPAVAVVGWLLTRGLPGWARGPVQGGLFVAGVVVLLAVPALTGRGGRGNPTSNVLPYGRNLGLVVGAVAVVTSVVVLVRAVRRSRRLEGHERPPAG